MAELLKLLEQESNKTSEESLDDASSTEEFSTKYFILQSLPYVHITRFCVVNNNYLKVMYELKKEEYRSRYGSVTEKRMVHATCENKVNSIIKNNLDWRRVSRNKYGVGVSFSEDADYANFHCNSSNGSARAFIVANVLISNQCHGDSMMKVPPGTTDTAVSVNKKVYVKFNDNEFLPLYVVFYNAPDRALSKFQYRGRRRYRF